MQKRKSRASNRTFRRTVTVTTGGVAAHHGCQRRMYDAIMSWKVLEMIVERCDRMVSDGEGET